MEQESRFRKVKAREEAIHYDWKMKEKKEEEMEVLGFVDSGLEWIVDDEKEPFLKLKFRCFLRAKCGGPARPILIESRVLRVFSYFCKTREIPIYGKRVKS